MEYIASVGVYDYERRKLCDLYDSQVQLTGQAYNIQRIQTHDGVNQLTFEIPFMVDAEKNFRWEYLKSEYLIRLYFDNKEEWFVANKPVKKKSKGSVEGSVSCDGIPILLKTKNIYMEFDDENGIGTIDYLMNQILAGTGWHLGYCEVLTEDDGVTEKVRSLSSGGKKGALGLITSVCTLFRCRPVYHTDTMTVDILSMKNRDMLFEAEIGKNLDALSVTYNSDDIVTRLYVEGEYGDHGYVGIDDVNPTGMPYLMNFDYYREIGLFTETHEAALETYLTDISQVAAQIKTEQGKLNAEEDKLNELIGQCKLAVYYTSQGFNVPMYEYGDPTPMQKALAIGDDVVVLNNNGTHRYETIVTTPQALIRSGDYGIAKFATKAAGSIGAKEVQVEAKEKQIDNLNKKINATTKESKKEEYRAEIAQLQDEIDAIYAGNKGLYKLMSNVMKSNGILNAIHGYLDNISYLRTQQDNIEVTFIDAMGCLLRDGSWQNNNYIVGQEAALLADATEQIEVMSRPQASYSFDYIRMHEEFGVPMEDIQINAIVRVNDDELDVHENLYVTKITTGIDRRNYGTLEVSNEDFTLSTNDLGQLLSRISQLADLLEQKNAIYNRAEAISRSGTFYADRLNGMIDVTKNQILSTVSNWYTDDSGNIVFESEDGGSAMMLSGAGFMLADSKTEDGEWNWRTTGTGHGLNADEIVAGFISADRLEAGSIATSKIGPDDNNFGGTLNISGNSSITGIQSQIDLMPDQIVMYVGQKGYGRTFIQYTDPAEDPANIIHPGDYWIQRTDAIDSETKYFSRNSDDEWVRVYDSTVITEAWAQINLNKSNIDLEVIDRSRADTDLYTKVALNATDISAEVTRATGRENGIDQFYNTKLSLDSNGKICLTSTNFSRIGSTSSQIYITPTQVAINSGGNLNVNASGNLNVNASGKLTVKSSGALDVASGGAINVNSGGDLNINSGGDLAIKSGGDITIESGGGFYVSSGGNIEIKSGGNLTIKSGGKFTLTSTYFDVASNGEITCTGGTIGGFTIGTTNIHNGVTSLSDTSHDGVYIGTDGILLGKGKFKVDKAGNLTASQGTFDGTVYANKLSGQIVSSQIGSGEVKTTNLGQGSVTTSVIAQNNVTYNSCSSGSGSVQSMLNSGVSAKDKVDDLVAGRITATQMKATTLNVNFLQYAGNSGSNYYNATWKLATDSSGNSIYVMGRNA